MSKKSTVVLAYSESRKPLYLVDNSTKELIYLNPYDLERAEQYLKAS